MSFTETQVRKLRSKLNPRYVRTREAEGLTLSYLEGWHVVAEANRIFGFDAWDRETIASDCVWTKQINGRYCAAYVARVRITVRTDGGRVIREGCGVGESNAATPGQAHDFAAKAAETDATKRALSTFGNAFGLSLYGTATASSDVKPKAGATQSTQIRPAADDAAFQKRNAAPVAKTEVPPVLEGSPAVPVPTAAAAPVAVANIFPPDRIPAPPPERQGIDKSVLAISEPRRVRDAGHRHFVASHPCVVCGRTPAEAHHVRFAQPRAMGRKVSDQFTVPLCALHHRDLHAHGNELSWWGEKKLNPIDISIELWTASRGRYWNGALLDRQSRADVEAAPQSLSSPSDRAVMDNVDGVDDVR
jgi:DNA recombination protein Rad52